jgi:uncharacterized radical SAM superfamily Fe-S cluster-containing enzyme
VRGDLCEIAAMARAMGFAHIQLNTNGLRIAGESGLAQRLAESGVTTAYLSFDGLDDGLHEIASGRHLAALKRQAVERLSEAGIAVVLVPVLLPGAGLEYLGGIISFAREHMPAVRGVHFQPMALMGRFPEGMGSQGRTTIPDVLRALEEASSGELRTQDFVPGSVEHALCSFRAVYILGADGRLHAVSGKDRQAGKASTPANARKVASQQWSASKMPIITIGGMAFQDAYTVDIQRLKRCTTHIIGSRLLYPLCAKYLTSTDGTRLYEGID